MRKLRFIGTKKQLLRLIVCAVLVLCALGSMLLSRRISQTLDWNDTARRWQGSSKTAFSQVSCFLPADAPITVDAVQSFRQTLQKKLTEASLTAPEGGSLYTDTYYGSAQLSVTGKRGSSTVKVMGVGGNFFLFHPLRLRSGSYISSRDVMQDRVVLDEELAWKLFGGVDVAGLTVTVGNRSCIVAGVIAREGDFADKLANMDGAGLFMSYDEYAKANEKASVTAYEIVMPNMIDGFARGIMKDNFPVGSGDIVENTTRYGLSATLNNLKNYGKRSMRSNGVIYPYWENASRLTEDYVGLLLIATVLLFLYPAVELIRFLVGKIRRVVNWTKQELPREVEARIEEKREARYADAFRDEEILEQNLREDGLTGKELPGPDAAGETETDAPAEAESAAAETPGESAEENREPQEAAER